MISQTLIAVTDVELASQWYQTLLGCESTHGGSEYERLAMPGADSFFMQLHAWEAHDHPNLEDPNKAVHGYGVLLWFTVDDFDAAVRRARDLSAEIIKPPHLNSFANHQECWLRDRDGYVVVIVSLPDEKPSGE